MTNPSQPDSNLIAISSKQKHTITWILLCIMPIIGMVVDLIAPSLPAIANDLNASATISKNVVAMYLLGYALGNFVTGFLSDALGRKQLLRGALMGFILVSLLPIFFPTVASLLCARLLQGITMGAIALLIRASLSDIVPKEKLVQLGVMLGTMWGIGPVLGPILGGYLQFYSGWKAGFYFLAGSMMIAFITVLRNVPETHVQRHRLNFSAIKTNLVEVISHPLFMVTVIFMGLAYSGIIGFNTVARIFHEGLKNFSQDANNVSND